MNNWFSLAAICVAVGSLLGYIQWQTEPAIKANREAKALATLRELVAPLPIATHQIDTAKSALAGTGFWPICATTTIAQTTFNGYGGPMTLLLSYQAGTPVRLTQLRVVKHAETPGIGDFFERRLPSWLAQLAARTPVQAKPPTTEQQPIVDAVAGATITVNALVNAVRANATAVTAVPFASHTCKVAMDG